MNYYKVENGVVIDGPCALPECTEDVSNFYLLDNETLRGYGWLPQRVEYDDNPALERTGEVTTVGETEVVLSFTYREKTQEESQNEVSQRWENVRTERNQKLSMCDWTQLTDAQLSDGEKATWQTYRQALRDVTKQSDPQNIVWPQVPNTGINMVIL